MNSIAYKETVIELRIDKIRQKLFFYDNLPPDEEIVRLIRQWRRLEKDLKGLTDGKQEEGKDAR